MDNRSVIAIDIDDVIAGNAQSFVDYTNQKYGTHLTIDDYSEHWAELWKVDHEEAKRRAVEYHESGHITTYPVIDGAREVLVELKKRFRIVAVTSRRDSIIQLTKDWLEKYYPNIFDDIVFCGFFDTHRNGFHLTKAGHYKNVGARYVIDDQPKHAFAAAEAGIDTLLFGDYYWNREVPLPPNVTRVKDWHAVRMYFEGRV